MPHRVGDTTPYARCPFSNHAAAAVAPDEAVGADAAGAHHHDRSRGDPHPWRDDPGRDHDHTAIGTAAAIGTAMEAGAASAGGLGGADAGERAGNQNCSEKRLHVSSLCWAASGGTGP